MRTVVVHGVAEAEAALTAAGTAGVSLLSPEGAASWPGPEAFAAIISRARRTQPAVRHVTVLDCGNEAGAALCALRCGWRIIVLHPCPALPQVAAAAAQIGAELLSARPEALDLGKLDLRRPNARATLKAWLASRST